MCGARNYSQKAGRCEIAVCGLPGQDRPPPAKASAGLVQPGVYSAPASRRAYPHVVQGRLDVAELGCGPGEAQAHGDSAEAGEVSELHHLSLSQ